MQHDFGDDIDTSFLQKYKNVFMIESKTEGTNFLEMVFENYERIASDGDNISSHVHEYCSTVTLTKLRKCKNKTSCFLTKTYNF